MAHLIAEFIGNYFMFIVIGLGIMVIAVIMIPTPAKSNDDGGRYAISDSQGTTYWYTADPKYGGTLVSTVTGGKTSDQYAEDWKQSNGID